MRPSLILRLAVLVVAAAALASLAYSVMTLGVRPLDGVEGEVLFEGQRLREGLPIYTDPIAGVTDYGPVLLDPFVARLTSGQRAHGVDVHLHELPVEGRG